MNSECEYQLTDEQNNSCDSDYEFVNDGSSHENSDCELEGYKKFECNIDLPTAHLGARGLSRHFDTGQGEKLKLCLSPEKISLLANSPKHGATREQNTEGQEQKIEKIEKIEKTVKNRLVPSFTIVPINLGMGKGNASGGRNDSKADLPEIVLTSFEVATAGKKTAVNKAGPAPSSSGAMDIKNHSAVVGNGCAQLPPPVVTAQTEFAFHQEDQSPSPESFVDNQLSAASSLSNRSSENSSDSGNLKEKPMMNTTAEVVVLHQQSKSNIDCVQSSVATTVLNSDAVPQGLKCGICHNVYKDPRTLQCLHSFCFQCLLDENFKQDSSIPFWSQPDQKEYDWKSSTKSSYSLKSASASSSPETTYREGSPASTRKTSRSSFTSFRSKKSIDKTAAKSSKKGETNTPPNERHRLITCKECHQTTEIPVGGIRQLPENFVLVRKIETMKLKIGNDVISKVWCSLCYVESNATYHCVTCTLNLCTFCKEAHERQRHTANHKIKNIVELRRSRNSRRAFINDSKFAIKCSMHPGFEMKAFCSSCLQVACADCLVLLHKGHKHESITKASANYQKVLKESTDQTRPLCEYAHHSVNRLNEIAKRINKKCDNVQSDVEAFMAAYTEAIEIHGRTLIQQINRARESKIQMIVEQQLDMEKRSVEAANVVQFSEELMENGTEVEILSFVNILLKRFEFCQQFKAPVDPRISDTLHFLPEVRAPSSKNQRNIPIFGIITTQTVEPTLCTLETDGYTQLRVHRRVEMTILSRDADGMPLCHGGLKVNAHLKYKESSSKVLPVEVNDRRDGSYGIAFVPDSQGTMVLTISINDKNIKGSPFMFAARTVRPHTGIYHCCSFCSSKGSKHATCSCDGRMAGYNGCGHGHNGHPGRRHWSCCGNVLENSECTAANKLLNP